jgi:sensor c-di-GMP phosphodiesterase-like protein
MDDLSNHYSNQDTSPHKMNQQLSLIRSSIYISEYIYSQNVTILNSGIIIG